MLAQIETALRAIDHASQQSILWIMIALMVALAAFAWYVIRYLLTREEARARRDEEMVREQIRALIENTAMMREIATLLAELKAYRNAK